MAHTHDNCLTPQYGEVCLSGAVFTYCDYEDCGNETCTNLGHCACNCHSGKVCDCGYVWEKM